MIPTPGPSPSSRTYDALDRLTLIDYPNDDDEDTTYTYDSSSVSFSKGRLTSIERNGASISYAYDRFGRLTQDGVLTSSYDKNGNALTIGYPNSVTATYTYDFADRQSTLPDAGRHAPCADLGFGFFLQAAGPACQPDIG